MNTDQLAREFRAADPTGTDDAVRAPAATVRAALAVEQRVAQRPAVAPSRPRRRRTWIAVAAVAVVAATSAIVVPLVSTRSTPTAQAAIRLAPFDGLMTPYVLTAVPAGLTAVGHDGGQGSTTTAYVAPNPQPDSVYVAHTAAPVEPGEGELPHVDAARRLADGSWVTVSGYGRFAVDATVRALLATARAAPTASPLRVELAPTGWQLAAFKDLEPGEGVVTLTPDGTLDGPDEIDVIRYHDTKTDFPVGYSDRGPTSPLTSLGRPGILMRGADSWTLQLRLPDGGSLILLLPARMDRDQVQRFADGVSVPAG